MVDKNKLGRRYTCFQCSLKFYDLNRPEPFCPKCGADQREDPNPDPREAILAKFRGKGASKATRIEDEVVEGEEAEEGAEEAEGEEDEIEDEEEEREEPVDED